MALDRSSLRPVDPTLAARYRAEGHWTDESLGELVARGLETAAPRTFQIHSALHPWEGTVGEVDQMARSLARELRERGVEPGDVVVFQLPNWVEAAVTFWATAYLGAVIVPIVHFYGAKEVGYILDTVEPKVVVTPDQFGALGYLSAGQELLAGRDAQWLVVSATDTPVPERATAFASLLSGDPVTGPAAVDPDSPALVGFTSGTTRNPKGVVHSHNTIGFENRQLSALSATDRPNLTGTPVGHFMGMLSALLGPLAKANDVNLIDVWDPGTVIDTMVRHDLCMGGGATFFLTSILDHPDFDERLHLSRISVMGLGGSPVPVAVTERASKMGVTVYRAYGSTEHPSVTGCYLDDSEVNRLTTDGHALPGVEIRLDDEGQILTRGPDCFIGYTDAELTAAAFDDEGWYHTGDVGTIDDQGYLTITDRVSDVIIRGGENISAQEIEEQLAHLAGVAEVNVVSAPDERFGEHAAAVMRMHPGADTPTLEAVCAHLDSGGLARQKWPESLFVVDDYPRTATGKVQKFRVRQLIRDGELTPVAVRER